jgi:hypothetical protein
MIASASLLISVVSLLLSLTVAWLTLLRRGKVSMTQPVLVGFLYDLPGQEPKIFFHAMLYATGKRGHIIEALYLRVRRGESSQTFNFWMYGETKDLKIGSGLRAGEDGVSFNHHFLPPKDPASFQFLAGEYVIEVYARIVNRSSAVLLSTVKLSLSPEEATALRDPTQGVLFTWGPDSQRYRGQVSAPVGEGRSKSVSGAGRARQPFSMGDIA